MKRKFPICVILVFLSLVTLIGRVRAEEPNDRKAIAKLDAASTKFFETKIRPVLVKECYACHAAGAKEIGGKLRLDSSTAMRVGGESGPLWKDTNPETSVLIQALRHQAIEMPPDGPLTEAVVNDFIQWVKMGAPDPRSVESTSASDTAPTKDDGPPLWSLKPIGNPAAPTVKASGWAYDRIDAFVLARLDAAGLKPAADASPVHLARRLYYDLTGLAPTYQEVQAFEISYQQDSREATRNLVDRLLASDQFGVRWGRHWLDVARFAESNGNDGLGRNATFPHAWRYRDYVIESFTRDTPFDRFLIEQIAGDLLPAATPAERDRNLIATGFLAIGSKPAKAMNNNFDMDVVDDQINVIGSGVMGLSVACARCHDHKHDPIPTKDYYALAGIFKSTQTLWGAAAYEKLTAPVTALHELKATPATPPTEAELARQKSAAVDSDKPPKSKYKPGTALAMGVRDAAKPADCKVHIKGESKTLGPLVPRSFLSAVITSDQRQPLPADTSGRLELANWLTRTDHPLTARVMANRVWLNLMGRGLVTTPDDFGRYGQPPSHPQLLDHLATRLINEQWSIKQLIRSIVLSRTYQLSGEASAEDYNADPDNRFFARRRLQRLDSESLRDQMLQAAGQLNVAPAHGSAIRHFDVLVNKFESLHLSHQHRSVYLCMLRNSPPPELAAFDLPDPAAVAGARRETTLPAQTLFLLNSDFVVQQSRHLAQSLIDSTTGGDQGKIDELWRRTYYRRPVPAEVAGATQLLNAVRQSPAGAAAASLAAKPPNAELHAWSALSQALLTSNEFRYID